MVNSRVFACIIINALFLPARVTSAGCLQHGRKTQTTNGVLGSVSVTHVTYLWGEEGPFTHRYIVDLRVLGGSAHVEMSGSEYRELVMRLQQGSNNS